MTQPSPVPEFPRSLPASMQVLRRPRISAAPIANTGAKAFATPCGGEAAPASRRAFGYGEATRRFGFGEGTINFGFG